MAKIFLFAVILLYPAWAQAQDVCGLLAAHVPADGVEYSGDHTVSADIGGGLKQPVLPVTIPVSVDLIERYNLDVQNGAVLEPTLAALEIYPDGRVLYNGQDLSQRFEDICKNGAVSDGQRAEDVLKSGSQVFEVKEGIEGQVLKSPEPAN